MSKLIHKLGCVCDIDYCKHKKECKKSIFVGQSTFKGRHVDMNGKEPTLFIEKGKIVCFTYERGRK